MRFFLSRNQILNFLILPIAAILIFLIIVDHTILRYLDQKDKLQVFHRWDIYAAKIYDNNKKKIHKSAKHDNFEALFDRESNIFQTTLFKNNNVEKKAKRILIMGDSFVWGDGLVNMNHIWWRQLQRELNNRGYSHVEVIARGECGWSTRQQLIALKSEKLIQKYQPDIVIFGYVTNDANENIVKRYREINLSLMLLRLFSFDKLAPITMKLLENVIHNSHVEFNDKTGYPYHIWEQKLLEGSNFDAYNKTVGELKEYLDSIDIPSFFVTLPSYPVENFIPLYQPIKKLYSHHNIQFYDLLDSYIKEYGDYYQNMTLMQQKSYSANPSNGHPGLISTHFYANQVTDILEKDYSSILLNPSKVAAQNTEPFINDIHPNEVSVRSDRSLKLIELQYDYAAIKDKMLIAPFGRRYVQINFSSPIKFKTVTLSKRSKKVEVGIISSDIYDRKIQKLECENLICANLYEGYVDSLIISPIPAIFDRSANVSVVEMKMN